MSTPTEYDAAWQGMINGTVPYSSNESAPYYEEFTEAIGSEYDHDLYDSLPLQMQAFTESKQSDQKECAVQSMTTSYQPYDFCLVFPQETNLHTVAKSRRCHYSHKLKVLYVKEQQTCPFTFSCDNVHADGLYLRATVVYTRLEDAKEMVRRCGDHTVMDQDGGSHLMSSRHERSLYDSSNNKLSVLVPYECGHEGEVGHTFTFEFACRSSCKTPLKNKPMKIVFTLEIGNTVLGQDSVVVKISSSPYRDMTNAEEKHDPASKPSRKRKLKSSCLMGDETYEGMVHEDIAFAQYARRKRPEWWIEYHQDEGCSTSMDQTERQV